MDEFLTPALTFGELLQKDPRASQFYNSCTPAQRHAILMQLPQLGSREQIRAFVEHLPSSAL